MKNEAKDERLAFWLSLSLLSRGDYRLMNKLVNLFPEKEVFFKLRKEELMEAGLEEEVAHSICSGQVWKRGENLAKEIRKHDFWVVHKEDDAYPPLLREIPHPPFLLYGAGEKDSLLKPAVAIVGTRRPTLYGRLMAEKLAAELARRGIVIVSGLARGIDSFAHRAAINQGQTIAVLGSGLECVYPPENRGLCKQIRLKGAVVSEYPPDEPPLAHHFPWRNRLISGLSLGVVVVEASSRSGSLITAHLALEQNREVMAVPGKAGSELSQGTNGLIKAGAKLVEGWEDVVSELPSSIRDAILLKEKEVEAPLAGTMPLTGAEKKVLAALSSEEALPLEEIVGLTRMPVAELQALLLQLEIKGLVLSSAGPSYQRRG